jgi:pimeloyl-ACP methyl ester carboxylesterase
VRRLLLAVLVAAAGAGGCGGDGHAAHREHVKPSPTPGLGGVRDTGRVVALGDGRSLFLDCIGSGSPTIVLEAGLGGNTHDWDAVQPALGRTTRTCAYDRAGIGNSLAAAGTRDAADEVADLERLLAAGHVDPPYVLVGHSYGGLLVRIFAQAHAAETAGIVLVDSMGRNQTRRTMAIWPKSRFRRLRRVLSQPVRDGVDVAAGEARAARVRTLHDTPLAVVTAGSETFGGAPPRLAHALGRLWATMQDELAALSSDHVHVVAVHSDHFVQGPRGGQPDVVTRAVRAVVHAARDHAPLPPCAQLFHGRGVRCRPDKPGGHP